MLEIGLDIGFVYGVHVSIKSELKRNRISVDELAEAIVEQKNIIEKLENTFEISGQFDAGSLMAERENIENRLKALECNFSELGDVTADFDSAIRSENATISKLAFLITGKTARVKSLKHVIEEVDAEIETLTLNDEASDRFRNFDGICDNKECGMFAVSRDSYGKSLVYLKDQLKDLVDNISHLEMEISQLVSEVHEAKSKVSKLDREKENDIGKSKIGHIAKSVRINTKRLVEIETQFQASASLITRRKNMDDLTSRRGQLHTAIEALAGSASRSEDGRIRQARDDLTLLINQWVDTLKATGLQANAAIDPDFNYSFGNERYTALDGSLRTRAVLAFHAALFEYGLNNDTNHPRLLVLDTPKQQELKADHLQAYIQKLRDLCDRHSSAQVVFSSSEFEFDQTDKDEIWLPAFPGENHNMYLGVEGT